MENNDFIPDKAPSPWTNRLRTKQEIDASKKLYGQDNNPVDWLISKITGGKSVVQQKTPEFVPDSPEAQDKPLEYPIVSPEFAAIGLTRAGTGVINAALQKAAPKLTTIAPNAGKQVAGGMSFTKGSVVGDVGAQAAIDTADASMGQDFQEEHPYVAGGIKLGAGLIGGGLAGYAGERNYIKSLNANTVDQTVKQADTFVPDDQSVKVAEALTTKNPIKEMTNDELMQAAGLKPKYPQVPDQYRVETPVPPKPYEPNFRMVPNYPPVPYVDEAAKAAEDARLQRLAQAEADANVRRARSAEKVLNEKMYGDSEDALKAANAQAFKPRPGADSTYKTMTPEERSALEKEAATVFAHGGNALGGALGGGALGGTEAAYEDIVQGKDLTLGDYLTRIGAGALVGAGLGKRYGGKEGTKMFVGAKPDEPGAFSDIYDQGVRKWIDDGVASLKALDESRVSHKLSDVLDHPELFKKYPELADIRVSKGNATYFSPEMNHIKIQKLQGVESKKRAEYDALESIIMKQAEELNSNGKLTPEIEASMEKQLLDFADKIRADESQSGKTFNKGDLLHEVQHAIQKKEGWSRGGSPDDFTSNLSKEEIDKILTNLQDASFGYRMKERFGDSWEKQYETFMGTPPSAIMKNIMRNYGPEDIAKQQDEWLIARNPVNSYLRLAGEQESRAVQAALKHPGLTPYSALKAEEGTLPKPIIKMDDGMSMSKQADEVNLNGNEANNLIDDEEAKNIAESNGYRIFTHNGYEKDIIPRKRKGSFERFDGIFASSGESSNYGNGKYETSFFIKPDKIAGWGDSDIDYDKAISFLKKQYPGMSDEDIDVLYDITAKDKNIYDYDVNPLSDYGYEDLGDASWEAQNIRGLIAKDQGYDAIEMSDEFGTSYFIPAGSKAKKIRDFAKEDNQNDIMMMHGGGAWLSDKAEKGMDDLIRTVIGKPLKGAVNLADKATGGKITQAWDAVKNSDVTDIITGHKIYGKRDYMELRDTMFRNVNANQVNYENLHRQLSLMDEGARKNLYRYMTGDHNVELHPSIKAFADEYIEKINQKGQELVDLGILEPAQFEKFKGRYLHRNYMKYLAEGRATAFSNKKTIKGVYSRGNQWTGTKAEYDQLMSEGKIGDFFDGKIEATKMQNGQYRFSQDWTPEQRAKWGEVDDIAYALPETLSRMDDMIANGTFLRDVLSQTGYVLDNVDDSISGLYRRMEGKRYGALNGKWVPRDIANDIDKFGNQFFGANPDEVAHQFREGVRTYLSLWKSSHTLYNPKAHVNNIMSNVTLHYMEGIAPHIAVKNAIKGAEASYKVNKLKALEAKKLIGLSDEESRTLNALASDDDVKLYMRAEGAGLFGRSQLNDILNKYVNNTREERGMARTVHNAVGNLYEGEDNVMRYSLLKSLMDNGEDFESAITHVNRTIPDYSKPMSEAAQWLRGTGITPFMSWTYYSMPIMLRQMKEHPTRALGLIAAMSALYEGFGIDAPLPFTDSEDMPKEGFAYKRIPIYKDGKEVMTLKVDKWIPHGELTNPVEFLRGMLNFGAWQPSVDLIKNNNAYFNAPITQKEGLKGAYDLAKYGVQNVLPMPDIADQLWNLGESNVLTEDQRRTSRVITPRTTLEELLNIGGLNVLSYDKAKQQEKYRKEKIKERKQERK